MKISVVIVTYNRMAELAELLESILQQTEPPHEIIIVNDAGENVELLVKLYRELPIKIIDLKENIGHVRARNNGIEHVTGDVIMLCDDDDFISKTHIERAMMELQNADFLYFDAEIVQFEKRGDTRYPLERRLFAYHYNLEEMKKFSTYVPSGSVYKKDLHEKIGLFDPEVHNYWDWDFFLRAAQACIVKRIPMASVIYAFSNNGLNQSSDLGINRKRYLDRLCEKHQLGDLPTKNFFVLLDEPELKEREAKSEVVWNGEPIQTRVSQWRERNGTTN